MFKQDYEALAALIKAQRKCDDGIVERNAVKDHLDDLARDMAQWLGSKSPHFDATKFLTAAGVEYP